MGKVKLNKLTILLREFSCFRTLAMLYMRVSGMPSALPELTYPLLLTALGGWWDYYLQFTDSERDVFIAVNDLPGIQN